MLSNTKKQVLVLPIRVRGFSCNEARLLSVIGRQYVLNPRVGPSIKQSGFGDLRGVGLNTYVCLRIVPGPVPTLKLTLVQSRVRIIISVALGTQKAIQKKLCCHESIGVIHDLRLKRWFHQTLSGAA